MANHFSLRWPGTSSPVEFGCARGCTLDCVLVSGCPSLGPVTMPLPFTSPSSLPPLRVPLPSSSSLPSLPLPLPCRPLRPCRRCPCPLTPPFSELSLWGRPGGACGCVVAAETGKGVWAPHGAALLAPASTDHHGRGLAAHCGVGPRTRPVHVLSDWYWMTSKEGDVLKFDT